MRIGRAVLFSAIIASLILSPAGAHWLGEKGKEGTHQEGHQQENAESGEQQAVEDLTGEERAKAYFTDLTLLDQDGKEVRFYSDVLKDRVVLITFFYTDCGDACPLVIEKLKEVEKIIDKRMGKDIFFVLISVDPKNDTVEAVKKYQEDHGVEGGWIFLTGKKSNLDHITQKLGQYQQKKETHSTLFLVGNVKTKHWAKVQPIYPSAGIAQKLKELAAES
jgi:cytochrome oxidase Cu insertion factor (SCO1/SenC/PrrC family)